MRAAAVLNGKSRKSPDVRLANIGALFVWYISGRALIESSNQRTGGNILETGTNETAVPGSGGRSAGTAAKSGHDASGRAAMQSRRVPPAGRTTVNGIASGGRMLSGGIRESGGT